MADMIEAAVLGPQPNTDPPPAPEAVQVRDLSTPRTTMTVIMEMAAAQTGVPTPNQ